MDDSSTTDISNDVEEPTPKFHDITYNKDVQDLIQHEIKRIRTRTLKIGIFGATNVGKSSLCNTLFGREAAKIGNLAASVRNPRGILTPDDADGGLILVDVPNVSENLERYQGYIELYQRLTSELDLILWAIKGDDNAYASAARAYRAAIKPHEAECPVILVVTQADRIEPCSEWDEQQQRPSGQQKHNQEVKRWQIKQEFDVRVAHLVAVSAMKNYNIDLLISTMVLALPNHKKASLVREARRENISDEVMAISETGILDHLAEKVGDSIYHAREFLIGFVAAAANRYNSRISKIIVSWLSEK